MRSSTPEDEPSDLDPNQEAAQEDAQLKPFDIVAATYIIRGYQKTNKTLDELIFEIDAMGYHRPSRLSIVHNLGLNAGSLTLDRICDPVWKETFKPLIEKWKRWYEDWLLQNHPTFVYHVDENGNGVLVITLKGFVELDADFKYEMTELRWKYSIVDEEEEEDDDDDDDEEEEDEVESEKAESEDDELDYCDEPVWTARRSALGDITTPRPKCKPGKKRKFDRHWFWRKYRDVRSRRRSSWAEDLKAKSQARIQILQEG